ncbi:hypothetical protein KP509_07G071300 [Ceratopteris richardii]|uniref:Uncharacterized protein n=1 Tax=Ceratopteris richardii TaxID=49495 RepID=A0A8T2UC03_CERRI|nr:hypothetical protein KP509_07G071300 [Ceratopteris richardii]
MVTEAHVVWRLNWQHTYRASFCVAINAWFLSRAELHAPCAAQRGRFCTFREPGLTNLRVKPSPRPSACLLESSSRPRDIEYWIWRRCEGGYRLLPQRVCSHQHEVVKDFLQSK